MPERAGRGRRGAHWRCGFGNGRRRGGCRPKIGALAASGVPASEREVDSDPACDGSSIPGTGTKRSLTAAHPAAKPAAKAKASCGRRSRVAVNVPLASSKLTFATPALPAVPSMEAGRTTLGATPQPAICDSRKRARRRSSARIPNRPSPAPARSSASPNPVSAITSGGRPGRSSSTTASPSVPRTNSVSVSPFHGGRRGPARAGTIAATSVCVDLRPHRSDGRSRTSARARLAWPGRRVP